MVKFAGVLAVLSLGLCLGVSSAAAQEPSPAARSAAATATKTVAPPPGYVIGPQDVLAVGIWNEKDMSAVVVVRPDGKISLPLLNEVQAAGYTPEQLRAELTKAAAKLLIEDPTATVDVKEIHSRNVFITGAVMRPGTYPLMTDMTVLQLIAVGGGLQEYADSSSIVILRTESGRQQYHKFHWKDVIAQKRPEQNLVLRPGDTVVVP